MTRVIKSTWNLQRKEPTDDDAGSIIWDDVVIDYDLAEEIALNLGYKGKTKKTKSRTKRDFKAARAWDNGVIYYTIGKHF